MEKIILTIAICGGIVFSSFIGHKVVTLGGDSDDWVTVCVKGQTVYKASFVQKAMAVNALDKQGNPIPCGQNDS